MAPIATYLIDYPEAKASWKHISSVRDLPLAGTLQRAGGQMSLTKVPPRPIDRAPFIVINGSGNYHHETLPLLHAYLELTDAEEIAYVQIDAHPDKETGYRWMIGCASFVGNVMEHPRVRSVHLLGLNQEALQPDDYPTTYTRKFAYYRCAYFEKLHQYLAETDKRPEVFFGVTPEAVAAARANASTRRVQKKALVPPNESDAVPSAAVHWRSLDDFDPELLPDLPVYLTIDLDVCRNKPVTDWKLAEGKAGKNRWGVADNQGVVEWRDLLALVRRIGETRKIGAADFCGLTEDFENLKPKTQKMSLDAVAQIYGTVLHAIEANGAPRRRLTKSKANA